MNASMFAPTDRVLELGGGDRPLYHPNLDVRALPTVDVVQSLTERFPFKDQSFDGIYCQYALEHVSWRQVRGVVAEAARVLRDGGRAVFVIPNTLEQMKWALQQPPDRWTEYVSQNLFGDQNYGENAHAAAFSPDSARLLFHEAGFKAVEVRPLPGTPTDMVVTATAAGRALPIYELPEYWNGPLGYRAPGYQDFPVHGIVVDHLLGKAPTGKILDVGCAAGYVVRRLRARGFDAWGCDVSQYAIEKLAPKEVRPYVQVADVRALPYEAGSFDLVYCASVLEHLSEPDCRTAAAELQRVAGRGVVAVCLDSNSHFHEDPTHRTVRPLAWWRDLFLDAATWEIRDDREEFWIATAGKKLNLGSFTHLIPGWTNIDILPVARGLGDNVQFLCHDLRAGIPFPDQSAVLVNCSHLIEHITFEEGKALLRECWRVLKPGGVVRVATPDLRLLTRAYLDAGMERFHTAAGQEVAAAPTQGEKLARILYPNHLVSYDAETLRSYLEAGGFREARSVQAGESRSSTMAVEVLDQHQDLSLIMEAER